MSWFSRLTVRGRTVVVGSVLTATLCAAGAAIPIPYVAIGPGVTYDTLGAVDGTEVITFTGDDIPASVTEASPTGGQLNMTTISITDGVPLFEALGLWTTGRYALAPREDYFPPDKTVEQVQEQDAQAFRDSQSAAEIAAAALPGLPEHRVRRRDPGRLAECGDPAAAGPDRRPRRHPDHGLPVAAGRAGDAPPRARSSRSPCCATASRSPRR